MTLNASRPISLNGSAPANQNIALELGLSPTAQLSLCTPAVRTLAGVLSGPIKLPDNFWGKSSGLIVSYLLVGGGGGGAGASGVVILSVPTALYSGIISGSPTVYINGSNTIMVFTSSGSYTA